MVSWLGGAALPKSSIKSGFNSDLSSTANFSFLFNSIHRIKLFSLRCLLRYARAGLGFSKSALCFLLCEYCFKRFDFRFGFWAARARAYGLEKQTLATPSIGPLSTLNLDPAVSLAKNESAFHFLLEKTREKRAACFSSSSILQRWQ